MPKNFGYQLIFSLCVAPIYILNRSTKHQKKKNKYIVVIEMYACYVYRKKIEQNRFYKKKQYGKYENKLLDSNKLFKIVKC